MSTPDKKPEPYCFTKWEFWSTIAIAQLIAIAMHTYLGPYIGALKFW